VACSAATRALRSGTASQWWRLSDRYFPVHPPVARSSAQTRATTRSRLSISRITPASLRVRTAAANGRPATEPVGGKVAPLDPASGLTLTHIPRCADDGSQLQY